MVKEEMIVYDIADKEDITVSDEEYDKYIKDQLKKYGYTEEQYKEQTGKTYEEANGEDNIRTQVYKDKVQDFILKHAKVKGKDK
jgi:FKBP-type peptidyl-prolyl cis-trans isomerase (trigger factor)